MTYEQILGGRKTLWVVPADKQKKVEGFWFSYAPDRVSIAALKQLNQADSLDVAVAGLMIHGIEWNLKDNDGKAVATTKEAMETVPLPILKLVGDKISEEETPKETK